MIDGAWRLWRGFVVGVAVVAIAVLGHVLAGGTADVHSVKFVMLALTAVPIAVRLSDREWTTWRLICALAIAQMLIHVALQVRLFAPTAMAPMAHMPGMNMSPVGPFSPQSTMFFSHVTAVVVTALVLRRGEEFVLAIRARLATALFFGFREVRLPALGQLVVRAVARPESLRHLPALAGAVTRRGPPLMCAAPLFS